MINIELFTEYKSYMYMFKLLTSQFNYLQMPLAEQELLILPEKMSSPKVLMGFILLNL
jgi:gluconate kinase